MSIIKKKKKKHHRYIVLLAKTKLNITKVSISEALIDSNISHDELVSINNVQKEYDNMKEEIKNSNYKYVWYTERNTNLRKRLYWN